MTADASRLFDIAYLRCFPNVIAMLRK